jgi:hypothetical protein
MVLTSAMLKNAGLKPDDRVLDLENRLRCRECDARAAVSIKWEG